MHLPAGSPARLGSEFSASSGEVEQRPRAGMPSHTARPFPEQKLWESVNESAKGLTPTTGDPASEAVAGAMGAAPIVLRSQSSRVGWGLFHGEGGEMYRTATGACCSHGRLPCPAEGRHHSPPR